MVTTEVVAEETRSTTLLEYLLGSFKVGSIMPDLSKGLTWGIRRPRL
jgi:hypothetical protein